jgi:glycosyltransferase involved in cell wall biosynthesis
MRVLVISAAFPPMPSGESTNAYHLCQQLAGRGFDVHVLTTKGNDAGQAEGVTVHPVMERWSWSEVRRLRRVVRACAPEAVYLMYLGWTYNFQFMSTFIPTIVKQILPDVPVVTRFENVGGAGPHANSIVSRMIRKAVVAFDRRGEIDYQFGTLLRDSDWVVLLSGGHEHVLRHGLADVGRKCALIPPPANMCMSPDTAESRERGRTALGIPSDEFLFAYIGFVYPGKGIDTLLHAFRTLSTRRDRVRLAIIGGSLAREFPDQPNYLDDVRRLAVDLGVAGQVVWTGEYGWDDDVASTYLRAADVCVLPFETGVKLNNSSFSSAAAHGLPIVTTTHPALESQFVDRQNVLLCEPRDQAALADAMGRTMDDRALCARLSEGALKLAGEWYSWESAMEKTVRLLALPGRPTMSTSPGSQRPPVGVVPGVDARPLRKDC